MTTEPDPPLDELEEADLELEAPGAPAIPLPRFPSSLRRPTSPDPREELPPDTPPPAGAPPEATGPGGPSGPPTRSSTASTRALPAQEEWADPKDLQAAIGQVVDVGFVLAGQGLGAVERRAKGLAETDPKWVPTKTERQLVIGPAGRIARRHIKANNEALDTIDGCLIAAGVGHFAVTRLFDIDPLEKET